MGGRRSHGWSGASLSARIGGDVPGERVFPFSLPPGSATFRFPARMGRSRCPWASDGIPSPSATRDRQSPMAATENGLGEAHRLKVGMIMDKGAGDLVAVSIYLRSFTHLCRDRFPESGPRGLRAPS